jgi:hypothetical protein
MVIMKCQFEILYTSNINALLAMGQREARAFGGSLNGDINNGSFQVEALGGTFAGTYSVAGNLITVVLSNKPIMIPCMIIGKFLKDQIA